MLTPIPKLKSPTPPKTPNPLNGVKLVQVNLLLTFQEMVITSDMYKAKKQRDTLHVQPLLTLQT